MRFLSNKLFLGVCLVLGVASCTTPNDVLEGQLADLKTSEFISFVASIQDDKGKPISGATVELRSVVPDSATTTVLTATSGADGLASFGNVPAGGHLLTVTATDFLTAKGIADFTWREGYNYFYKEDLVVGVPTRESAIIPLYPVAPAAEDAATISGVMVIEADLTNAAPEVVANEVVVADLSNLVSVSSDGMAVRGYSFSGNETFGRATTDASGNYSMMVPASEDGSFISLLFPELQRTQAVATYKLNGQEFSAPQLAQVPTIYGPNVNYGATIPNFSGAIATFPAPPASGAGFTIDNFVKVSRDWSAFFTVDIFDEMPGAGNGALINVTNWGVGYDFSPTVEVVNTGSEDTLQVRADLAIGVSGYNLTSTVTGLAADTDYNVSLLYDDEFGGTSFISAFEVTSDGGGAITQSILSAGIAKAISDEKLGFGTKLHLSNEVVDSIYFVFPGGGGDGSVTSVSEVHRLRFNGVGRDYLAPTVRILDGSPTTALAFDITFGSNWEFDLNNSGISTPYVILPEIQYEYREVSGGTRDIDYFTSTSVINPNNNDVVISFAGALEPNASGDIVFRPLENGSLKLRTAAVTIQTPVALVKNVMHMPAVASVNVAPSGKVSGISASVNGVGYNTKFGATISPAVAGLPGSNGEVTLVGGEFVGVRFDWFGGSVVTNGGANYSQFANRVLSYDYKMFFTTSGAISNFEVRAGETVIRNVNYGVGRQTQSLN